MFGTQSGWYGVAPDACKSLQAFSLSALKQNGEDGFNRTKAAAVPRALRTIPRLRTPRGQRKYLTDAERRRFLAAADQAAPDLRAFCYVLAWSGARITEALNLTPADVQPETGCLVLLSLKKRGQPHAREVPVPPGLFAQLAPLGTATRPQAPFWPWARTTAWRHVKDVMAAAGVVGLHASPKGLRHGLGVHAVHSGVSLNLVQKWLGHADIATTAIYTDAMGAEEREIASRMWWDHPPDCRLEMERSQPPG